VGWWEERVLPGCIDRMLSVGPVMQLRARVCAGLSGRVLELGFGSGLNVGLYPARVASVDAVEPSDRAWALSADRRAGCATPVARTGLDGQRLEAADASYDAVLSTFTLCTIPDAQAALAEVRRVLRPGGSLHVLEHGLAPDAGVARWQRRLDALEQRVFGGCHLTRDLPALLAGAGLSSYELAQDYLAGPRVGRPWGWWTMARAA
jgi:ubiquinone/menaquinone biosynthesis C-methylase UbiE